MSSIATTPETALEGGRPAGMSMPLLGMVLFLASEVMFFAGLFGAYFSIRATAVDWPPVGLEHLHWQLPGFFTVVLVVSSFTLHLALNAIKRGNTSGLIMWTGVTIVLGAIFLAGQLYDYSTLDFTIRDGVYGTTFFTLTGFHGAHVFGGLCYLVIMLVRASTGQFTRHSHAAVEGASMYWHFVDVVWIVLFLILYVLK
ncbi:MAG: heme-copper oxidase subunit III [Mycobacteriales bacterium]